MNEHALQEIEPSRVKLDVKFRRQNYFFFEVAADAYFKMGTAALWLYAVRA